MIENDKKQEIHLTPQEQQLKNIFYLAFRFSQGSESAQSQIFAWLKMHNYLDGIPIENTPPRYIYEIAIPPKHGSVLAESIRKNIDDVWTVLNSEFPLEGEMLLLSLLHSMASQEIKLIGGANSLRKGRDPLKMKRPDDNNDPFASFLRRYAINEEPTGNDAFDHLFRDLRPLMIEGLTNSDSERFAADRVGSYLSITPLSEQLLGRTSWRKIFSLRTSQSVY